MKQLIMAVLFGSVLCTPLVWSQSSSFIQQGKVTKELQQEGLSIAHSSLPLNSKARITNLSTGKDVEVTIVRLIPAALGRIADVSADVWRELELTPVTDVRITAGVSLRPQAIQPPPPVVATVPQTIVVQAPQTAVPQTAVPQTIVVQAPSSQPAVATAPRTTVQPAAKTAQAGTGSLDDLPSGVKFENNNNFIINGNPAGGAPSAVASTPSQPSVTYQAPALPSQPAVIVDKWPQQTSPAVTYQTGPQTQSPAIADNRPQSPQTTVTYQAPPQSPQSAAIADNWQQQASSTITYQLPLQPAQPAFDTRPQQMPQTAVASATRSNQGVNDEIWAQITKPATPVDPRMPRNTQEDRGGPSYNDVSASASRTQVFIDSPVGQPRPSVTVNNGTLSYMPPPPNEMRPQPVQAPAAAASSVSAPANSVVRIENWPPQNSQPVKRIEEMPHPRVAASEVIQQTANMPLESQSVQRAQSSQQTLSNAAATLGSQPVVNNVVTTPGSNPVINLETHTIEVPVNQAGVPLWDEIKPPSMNEIYSPVPNSRVFIDAPVDTQVPNVIINNSRQQ